jgi:hypothetical protein
VKIVHSNGSAVKRDWVIRLAGVENHSGHIFESKSSDYNIESSQDHETRSTVLHARFSKDGPSGYADQPLVIHLGSNMELSTTNIRSSIYTVLQNSYIEHVTKLKIWRIVDDDKMTVGAKVGSLSAIGLSEDVLGSVMEYLVADSRS